MYATKKGIFLQKNVLCHFGSLLVLNENADGEYEFSIPQIECPLGGSSRKVVMFTSC